MKGGDHKPNQPITLKLAPFVGKYTTMTIREEVIREIEQAPDDVLQALLTLLRLTQVHQSNPSVLVQSSEVSNPGLQKHYPLRGLPLVIAEDFDDPMTDLWDALG